MKSPLKICMFIATLLLGFAAYINSRAQTVVVTTDLSSCTPGTIPTMGVGGANGPCVAQWSVFSFGTPNSLNPAFGTAYQATDPAKPAMLSIMVETAYTITLANTQSDTVELRIGPVQTTVANGTGGTAVATYKNSLTGITLAIGMGTINRNQLTGILPTGWYFAVRRVAGTTATIQGAFDQPAS